MPSLTRQGATLVLLLGAALASLPGVPRTGAAAVTPLSARDTVTRGPVAGRPMRAADSAKARADSIAARADSANARADAAFKQRITWSRDFGKLKDNPSEWFIVVEDSLVLFLPALGKNGSIHAVDAITGQRRWATEATPENYPAARGGTLFFVEGAKQEDNKMTQDLVALDARTGHERWRLKALGRRPVATLGLELEWEDANEEVAAAAGVPEGTPLAVLDRFLGLAERDSAEAALGRQLDREVVEARQARTRADTRVRDLEEAADSLCPERDDKNRCRVPKGTKREAYEATLATAQAALDSGRAQATRAGELYDSLTTLRGGRSGREKLLSGPLERGDYILRVAERQVDSTWTVSRLVALHRPGDTISVEIVRDIRDGAGKSTTIRRMMDITEPNLGPARPAAPREARPPADGAQGQGGARRLSLPVRIYGERPSGGTWSAPRIADSVVYFSRDSVLVAVDARSGAIRSEAILNGLLSVPLVDSGTVFVPDRQGKVHAVDRSTGQVRWATPQPWGPNDEKDRDISNRLLQLAISDSTLLATNHTDGIFALDARSGAQLWKTYTRGASAVAVEGGIGYLDTGLGKTLALRLRDGTELWRGTGGNRGRPEVANGEVFFGTGRYLVVLNAGTGQLKRSLDGVRSSVVVAHGFVYSTGEYSRFYAHGLANLEETATLVALREEAEAQRAAAEEAAAIRRGEVPPIIKSRCALEVDEDAVAFIAGGQVDTRSWLQAASPSQRIAFTRCLNERWNFRNQNR